MKLIFLILFFSTTSTTSFAQVDTIFLQIHDFRKSHREQYKFATGDNEFLYNREFSSKVRPFSDTLYSTKDSSLFNGILKLTNHWASADSNAHKTDWSYFVQNGKSSLVIRHLDGVLRDSIVDINDCQRFVAIGKNGEIREIKNYKNGRMHGYQFNIAYDSLKLETEYVNDTLIDVLNEDIIFVGQNKTVLTEKEFLEIVGCRYCRFGNWDLELLFPEELTSLPDFRMIMYQVLNKKEFNPEKKKDREKILKQLPTTKPKLH